MKIKLHILIALISIVLSSCATYSIQKQSLIDQLNGRPIAAHSQYYRTIIALIDYPSYNLTKVKCQDSKGNYVWLYPDKNTQFIFVSKINGEKVKAYFDTVILKNDTVFGYYSRMVGGEVKIPIKNIDKIFIHSETPKTTSFVE